MRWVRFSPNTGPEAVQRFEALHARYPGEAWVETRLDEARRQRDVAAWSQKAEAAAADGDWDTAVSALENLTALDAEHPDAAARLEQARTAQRCKALIDEMTALHRAGQWEAVVAAAGELARIDPDNPDPDGIVSDAHTKIAEPSSPTATRGRSTTSTNNTGSRQPTCWPRSSRSIRATATPRRC